MRNTINLYVAGEDREIWDKARELAKQQRTSLSRLITTLLEKTMNEDNLHVDPVTQCPKCFPNEERDQSAVGHGEITKGAITSRRVDSLMNSGADFGDSIDDTYCYEPVESDAQPFEGNSKGPLAPHGGCNWKGCKECFPDHVDALPDPRDNGIVRVSNMEQVRTQGHSSTRDDFVNYDGDRTNFESFFFPNLGNVTMTYESNPGANLDVDAHVTISIDFPISKLDIVDRSGNTRKVHSPID